MAGHAPPMGYAEDAGYSAQFFTISRRGHTGATAECGAPTMVWSYDQFAKRGMEPVLQFIASVGERLDKLRSRLQTLKQDILQRSIAIQIEATRDNTHRLERIQSEIKRMADETQAMNVETAAIRRQTADIAKAAAQLSKWRHLGALVYSLAGWMVGAVGGALAIWAYLFKAP